MTPQPLVSAVVTTRNEAANIRACLEALRAQTWPALEIIVVDNASTDATKALAAPLADQVLDKGPERSAQRNFGVTEAASGEYAIFLDADMIAAPGLIAACVERMRRGDCIALHIPEIVLGKGYFSRVRRFERTFYDGTPIDGARFFRRDDFVAVGGFDPAFSGPEDWDLDKKLKLRGKIGLLDPKASPEDLAAWPLREFVASRGAAPERWGNVILHNEADFDLTRYLAKKGYYAQSFDAYIAKWGKNDPDIRKQFGAGYRFLGVFLEHGKWRRFLARPGLAAGLYFLRFLVGLKFLLRRRGKTQP